jgi:uncharacterized protein YndB with AHSA1/START domain
LVAYICNRTVSRCYSHICTVHPLTLLFVCDPWQAIIILLKTFIMTSLHKADIQRDTNNKTIIVKRAFDAPVSELWRAWTDSKILDKWWAPKPWKAETKSFNFTNGGAWLYAMVSPEGQKMWNRVAFDNIKAPNEFSAVANFVEADGQLTPGMPNMHWRNEFTSTGSGSMVTSTIRFDELQDMQKILDMGFEGGYSMGLNNLEEMLHE